MKRLHIKLMLVTAAVLLTMNLHASVVDTDAALACAQDFMAAREDGRLKAHAASLALAHAEPSGHLAGAIDYYVFNTSDNAAFVIVAGDDRVEPILGYGNGALDMERLPCNLRCWLDGYKRQLEWLRNHPEVCPAQSSKCAPSSDITIEPMLTCQWNQGEPYDWQCAVYEGEYCLTGCVATAMAQVMYYWKYPAELPALPGYTATYLELPIEALPPVELDWDNMQDYYISGYYNDTQAAAVATLMRYCSQACLTDCHPEGSGSSFIDQLYAFKMFGYSRSARWLKRDNYSSEEWYEMVNEELLAGRPIPYDGSNGSGGHAFVIDGCADGKYHVNWGWGGYADGYFELDLLDPYPGCAYIYRQGMTCHVCPDDGSPVDLPLTFDFEEDGVYYKKSGDQAIVTSRDGSFDSYQGDVQIPREVTFEGSTYRVTAIDNMAFMGCTDLTTVNMPFVETIGESSFHRCPNLHEVTLGKALKSSGSYAFYNSLALEKVNIEDVNAWVSVDFTSYSSNPLYYAKRLYCEGQEMTDLVIGGNVKEIKKFTFSYCGGIKSVTIGGSVTSIGKGAFESCPDLEKVTIPDGIGCVDFSAFYHCPNLRDLEFKGSVGKIDDYAFNCCSFQGTFMLPSSVDSIGYAAFAGCEGIERLIIHDVGDIDDYAFYGCHLLKSVSFEGRVNRMANKVFDTCPSLSRVDVTDLGAWCSFGFTSSSSNPLNVAHHLYVDDKEVTELVVPAGVPRINDYAFVGCDGLTSAVFGNEVADIGKQAFYKCQNLAQVTLGDSVKTVGEQAFSTCSSLKRVVLGRGVDSLGAKAFNASMVIDDISCLAATPPVMAAKNCFSNIVYKNAAITVPMPSLQAYKADASWSQFVNMTGSGNNSGDVNGDGEVNIVDVDTVIGFILRNENEASCDVNGDGEVDITDVNTIIELILTS